MSFCNRFLAITAAKNGTTLNLPRFLLFFFPKTTVGLRCLSLMSKRSPPEMDFCRAHGQGRLNMPSQKALDHPFQ